MRSSHVLANRLMGNPVRNNAGETLGRIKDFVIEPVTGRIDFAILTIETWGAAPDRFIAVPWTALGLMADRDYVLLHMDKIALDRAPAFTESEWPDFADSGWRNHVYGYYRVSDPTIIRNHTVVERRDRESRKEMSVLGRTFLFLVFLVLLGFAYLIATRGWERAKADTIRSVYDVAYAMKETSADATLTTKVKAAVALNKNLASQNIRVESNAGVVTLRGEVADDQTRADAGKVAEDTPGVLQVHNELDVKNPVR